MPAKQLPDHKIKKWLELGHGPKKITELLLAEENIEVTPAAISMWRLRRGLEPLKPRYEDLIPWHVKVEHTSLWPVKMLRALARRRAGIELTSREAHKLDSWLSRLESQGLVVHYDGETEQGWFYVRPRDGVDKDVIRDPRL